MASILKVDKLDPQSGTDLEIGSSGDTITVPSGATITNSGTATGFGAALTGSTNNTVTTVTAANAITGESKLKFDPPKLTIGDGSEEDTAIIFDGAEQDFRIALDDSRNYLEIGRTSTVGGEEGIFIDTNNVLYLKTGTQTGKCHYIMRALGLPATVTLADDATTTFSSVSAGGLVMMQSNQTYATALFYGEYTGTTFTKISDLQSKYATSDSDGYICVYKGANSGDFTVKNRIGSSITVAAFIIQTSAH
tara:strand:- start:551 stop:1300 length:750 start_codon:yes stop_codon:yes gene_type:complete